MTSFSSYQSDLSQFLESLKAKDLNLEAKQREGLALFWNRPPIDLEERQQISAVSVRQKPYVYYQNF
jgi:hypothetical protein